MAGCELVDTHTTITSRHELHVICIQSASVAVTFTLPWCIVIHQRAAMVRTLTATRSVVPVSVLTLVTSSSCDTTLTLTLSTLNVTLSVQGRISTVTRLTAYITRLEPVRLRLTHTVVPIIIIIIIIISSSSRWNNSNNILLQDFYKSFLSYEYLYIESCDSKSQSQQHIDDIHALILSICY